MRRKLLRGALAGVAAAGMLLAASPVSASAERPSAAGRAGAPVTASLRVPMLAGPHSDQCFGRGHEQGVARPGANCWEGQICLVTNMNGHDYFEFCLDTASRSGVHVVTLARIRHARADYWDAVLVGYVTRVEGHDWPFRNPILDQRYRGYPVLNFHLVIDHKLQKDVCIGGIPTAAGIPIQAEVTGYHNRLAPTCSPIGQHKRNLHDTFMVWHPAFGHHPYEQRIVVVNYTNDEPSTERVVLTSADTSGIPGEGAHDEVWYLPLNDAQDAYQFWYRAYPSTNKR